MLRAACQRHAQRVQIQPANLNQVQDLVQRHQIILTRADGAHRTGVERALFRCTHLKEKLLALDLCTLHGHTQRAQRLCLPRGDRLEKLIDGALHAAAVRPRHLPDNRGGFALSIAHIELQKSSFHPFAASFAAQNAARPSLDSAAFYYTDFLVRPSMLHAHFRAFVHEKFAFVRQLNHCR